MSKEALNTIIKAESDADAIIETAKREARRRLELTEKKISDERALFSENLKSERTEKLRLADMQTEADLEQAAREAEIRAEELRRAYKTITERALKAAVKTVLNEG